MADAGDAESETASVFHKLGGYTALNAAVKLFYEKVLADELLAPYFEGVPMEKLRRKQMAFMAFAFGGSSEYFGKQVAYAHRDMILNRGLNLTHYDAVAGHFVATLQELHVPADVINEAAAVVLTTRPMFDPEALRKEEDNSDAAQNLRLQQRLLLLQQARSTAGHTAGGNQRHTSCSGCHPGSFTAPASFTYPATACAAADSIKVSTLAEMFAPAVQGVDADRFQELGHKLATTQLGADTSSKQGGPAQHQAPAVLTQPPPVAVEPEVRKQRRSMLKDILREIGLLSSKPSSPTQHAPPRTQASRLVLPSSSSSGSEADQAAGEEQGPSSRQLTAPDKERTSGSSGIYATAGAVQEWVDKGQGPAILSPHPPCEHKCPKPAAASPAAGGCSAGQATGRMLSGDHAACSPGSSRTGTAQPCRQNSDSSGLTLPGSDDDSTPRVNQLQRAQQAQASLEAATGGGARHKSPSSAVFTPVAAEQHAAGSEGPAELALVALANLSTLTEATEASDTADAHSEQSSGHAVTLTPPSTAPRVTN